MKTYIPTRKGGMNSTTKSSNKDLNAVKQEFASFRKKHGYEAPKSRTEKNEGSSTSSANGANVRNVGQSTRTTARTVL